MSIEKTREENIKEGNIKIAEFLGFIPARLSLDNDDQKTIATGFMVNKEFAAHASYSERSNFYRIEDLKFHKSWLWLSYASRVLLQPVSIRKNDYQIFEDCVKAIDKIRVQKKEKLFTKDEVIEGMKQAWIEGYKARDPYNKKPTPFDDFIKRFLNHKT